MLEVSNLSISFNRYGKGVSRRQYNPIRRLDLRIHAGEVVAVVGESGSGKSLLAHAVLGILPENAVIGGTIKYKGEVLRSSIQKRLRGKEIALIPQSVTYLNPLIRTGPQVRRSAVLSGLNSVEAARSTASALSRYGLAPHVDRFFPFQLSGGMARRVLAAAATAGNASLILADEPTTGIDPSTVSELLGHLRALADSDKAVMLITHDLEAALTIADKVAVFCAGTTVEITRPENFNGGKRGSRLNHPYTRELWNALPGNGFKVNGLRPVPSTNGCPFSNSCPQMSRRCSQVFPELEKKEDGLVRCINA